jgi:hypothetical protein
MLFILQEVVAWQTVHRSVNRNGVLAGIGFPRVDQLFGIVRGHIMSLALANGKKTSSTADTGGPFRPEAPPGRTVADSLARL